MAPAVFLNEVRTREEARWCPGSHACVTTVSAAHACYPTHRATEAARSDEPHETMLDTFRWAGAQEGSVWCVTPRSGPEAVRRPLERAHCSHGNRTERRHVSAALPLLSSGCQA